MRIIVIRAAFILDFEPETWHGGTSYYRNLFRAVQNLSSRQVEPVLFTGKADVARGRDLFGSIEVIGHTLFDSRQPAWSLRTLRKHLIPYDGRLDRLFLGHRIDALSHTRYLGNPRSIPAIGWIPDFQHRHLPGFYTWLHTARLNWRFRNIAKCCRRVVLSSRVMKDEFDRMYPVARNKSVVLHFSVPAVSEDEIASCGELKRRHGIPEKFLYVPNQFWAHKNHSIIVKALELLLQERHSLFVVATGSSFELRRRGYFDEFTRMLDSSPAVSCFKILGNVPRRDVAGLARTCVAMINPSLYEGWSTSVEEAKSIGKTILLSRIPVHIEQAPERGVFFDPGNPHELAAAMARVWEEHSKEDDARSRAKAIQQCGGRMQVVALEYEKIVRDAVMSAEIHD